MKIQRIIGLLLISVLLLPACDKISSGKERKTPGHRIVETGELSAIDTRTFMAERLGRRWNQMKIIGLLPHGTAVKAGDSIIQFDPVDVRRFIVDKEGDLETQMANLEKMKVDHESRRFDLASTLKSETAAFELKKLELEASRFESEKIREIKDLEFEQAKIGYNRVLRRIELNKVNERLEMKRQLLRIEDLKQDIADAYNIIDRLTVRTPIDGVFQIALHERTGLMLKLGDDVYAGNKLGEVPDLKWMKVMTTISENDFLKIAEGQEVTVRLDALPNVAFKGEIMYVGKLCRPKEWGSKQKVFDVEVKMLDSDERLKPGMTVSCEYHME